MDEPARRFRARAPLAAALELDPKLWTRGRCSVSCARLRWDWQAATAELDARCSPPEETGTVWSYAYVLSLLGRHDEAIAAGADARGRVLRGRRNKQEVAERLIDAGRFGEATEAADAARALNGEPGSSRRAARRGGVRRGRPYDRNRGARARRAFQRGAAASVGQLAAAYARAGREVERARCSQSSKPVRQGRSGQSRRSREFTPRSTSASARSRCSSRASSSGSAKCSRSARPFLRAAPRRAAFRAMSRAWGSRALRPRANGTSTPAVSAGVLSSRG